MDRNQLHWIEIRENWANGIYQFVGTCISELNGDAIYQAAAEGYYYTHSEERRMDGKNVFIQCAFSQVGRTRQELLRNMRAWIDQVCDGRAPEILWKVPSA